MKEYRVSIFDYKVLMTILNCNENYDFPTAYGVYKILKGIHDEDSAKYVKSNTFSTSISTTSKRVAMRITMLIRNHYITRIYDANTDALYLKLTPLGESKAKDYLKSHKNSLKPKQAKQEISIVHINKEDLQKINHD